MQKAWNYQNVQWMDFIDFCYCNKFPECPISKCLEQIPSFSRFVDSSLEWRNSSSQVSSFCRSRSDYFCGETTGLKSWNHSKCGTKSFHQRRRGQWIFNFILFGKSIFLCLFFWNCWFFESVMCFDDSVECAKKCFLGGSTSSIWVIELSFSWLIREDHLFYGVNWWFLRFILRLFFYYINFKNLRLLEICYLMLVFLHTKK